MNQDNNNDLMEVFLRKLGVALKYHCSVDKGTSHYTMDKTWGFGPIL